MYSGTLQPKMLEGVELLAFTFAVVILHSNEQYMPFVAAFGAYGIIFPWKIIHGLF